MFIEKTKDSENEPILQQEDSPPRLPIRYIIVFLCCLANTLTYAMRMNLSIAIIAMVRHINQSQSLDSNSSVVEIYVPEDEGAEVFDWDMETQQVVLGAFYYGYTVTPILGGYLVGKYGGFRVVLIGVLLSSLSTLSTPSAAKISVGTLILTRIIDGIGQGVIFPGNYDIIVKWSKLNERSTLLSISMSGMNIGPILSSYMSTRLCLSAFLGGWPSTFYIYGICGVTWCFGWCIVGSNEVANNRWISTFEKDSIYSSQSTQVQSENVVLYNVPWKKIVKSAPVLSLCACAFGFDYGYYLLFADIPTFFKTILGFEIKTIGLLNLIPQVVMCITTICGGFLGDNLISRGIFSVAVTRKLLTCFALGLPSILLVSLGYITDDVTLAVIVMTGAFGMYGFIVAGMGANAIDIAPNHSALIVGMMFSISSCAGFISPAVLGVITGINNTIYQWREVFWIVAGVQIFGLLAFLIFGSGEVQDWAN